MFNIVDTSRTVEFEEVCEVTAWNKLKEKFESSSQAAKCNTSREYETLSLRYNEDPEVFITKMDKIRWRLNVKFKQKITEEYMMIKIINGFPREYDSLIDSLLSQMRTSKGLDLTS